MKLLRSIIIITVSILVGLYATGVAQASQYDAAAEAFKSLPTALRYDVQMLLVTAGYSEAVSTEFYSTRIHDALIRFQADNGFPANGKLTPQQLAALHALADPVLQMWGLAVIRHPQTGFPLWVPQGLNLTQSDSKTGLTLKSQDASIIINFDRLPFAKIDAAFEGLKTAVAAKGQAVGYSILKQNFFVISTSSPSIETYMRFQAGAQGITGFWIFWRTDNVHYGKRLATLMSDLFRSASQGEFRAPPTTAMFNTATTPQAEPAAAEAENSASEQGPSSGSGFFVSKDGKVLTNAHVVKGCPHIEVSNRGSGLTDATLIALDATNDLALLQTHLLPTTVASLRSGAKVGETVSAFGYPLSGFLASSGNFTVGNVTASSGLQDDSRMLQISAPVQPGNSGGPLFDQSGNVIGIVVAKLDALKFASITHDLAQNVNFAIKSSVAATFLDANGVALDGNPSVENMPLTAVAELAKSAAAYIQCQP